MTKVEKVKGLRAVTVAGCIIACCIAGVAAKTGALGAALLVPFTCLSGACAFMYHGLDSAARAQVYQVSPLHLSTVVMHPYYLLAGVIFLNLLCVATKF